MKCCKCFWVFPRAIYEACTNPDCQHKFCEDCQPVLLREPNQEADAKDQPTSYVNVDLNASSARALSASNGMASEDLPSLASSLAFNYPLQQGPALLPTEQIIAPPEQSARGKDDKPVDGDWFWTCHMCGEGPWFYGLVGSCPMCGHIRCVLCIFEETEST